MFGVAVVLFYGRRGYQPLDQSIVFDGGWRILEGQIPWVDFQTPNAVTPSIMQAGFFWVLGTTWFAYCLHAAIISGFACVVTTLILQKVGLSRNLSLLYGALTAFIFYAPMGTPYMEQHAFFFLLLATWATVCAVQGSGRARIACYAVVPPLVVLALFSKQLPTVLWPPVAVVYVLVADRQWRSALTTLVVSAVGTLVVTVGLLLALGIDLGDVVYYVVELPRNITKARGTLDSVVPVPRWRMLTPSLALGAAAGILLSAGLPALGKDRPARPIPGGPWAGLGVLAVAVVGFLGLGAVAGVDEVDIWAITMLGAVAVAAAVVWMLNHSRPRPLDRLRVAQVLLAVGLLLVCAVFTSATGNQFENGIPFAFLALGMVQPVLSGTLRYVPYLKVVTGVAIAAVVIDSAIFAIGPDRTRKVADMEYDPPTSAEEAALPDDLSWMQWDVPGFIEIEPGDLRDAAAYLEQQDGDFLLFGTASVLYALADQPSTSPSLWYHPNLTFPLAPAKQAKWARPMLRKIDNGTIRRVVLEPEPLYGGARLRQIPELERRIEELDCGRRQFGAFEVVELCR